MEVCEVRAYHSIFVELHRKCRKPAGYGRPVEMEEPVSMATEPPPPVSHSPTLSLPPLSPLSPLSPLLPPPLPSLQLSAQRTTTRRANCVLLQPQSQATAERERENRRLVSTKAIFNFPTYVWKRCLHGSLLAVVMVSQQMAHTSSTPPISSWSTKLNLQPKNQ